LFDERGIFQPQSDDVVSRWPDNVVALYQRVSDAFTASEVIERKVERTTKQLHETVAELREVEGRLAKFGRKSAVENVREWIESQRRFG
jgi:hypothetical protein